MPDQIFIDPRTGRRVRISSGRPLTQEEIDYQLARTAWRIERDIEQVRESDGTTIYIGGEGRSTVGAPRSAAPRLADVAPPETSPGGSPRPQRPPRDVNQATISPMPKYRNPLAELGGRIYSGASDALKALQPEQIAPATSPKDFLSRVVPLSAYNTLRGAVTAPVTIPAQAAVTLLDAVAGRGEVARQSRAGNAVGAEKLRRELNRSEGRAVLGMLPFGQEAGSAVYDGKADGNPLAAASRFGSALKERALTDPVSLALDVVPAAVGGALAARPVARRVSAAMPRPTIQPRPPAMPVAAPRTSPVVPRLSLPTLSALTNLENWDFTPSVGSLGGNAPRFRAPRRVEDFPGPDTAALAAQAPPRDVPLVRESQLYDRAGNPKRIVLTEADRERVGYYVPRGGRESSLWGKHYLMGGIHGPLQPGYQGVVGWMSRAQAEATKLAQRAAEGEVMLAPFLNKRDNAIGNPKFLEIYLDEIDAAVERGELTRGQVYRAILGTSRKIPALRGLNVRSTDRLREIAPTLPFEAIRPIVRSLGDVTKGGVRRQVTKYGLIDPAEVLAGYNDPDLDAMPDFSLPALIDLTPGGIPGTASELTRSLGLATAIPEHNVYEVLTPGSWAGALPPGANALEYIKGIAPGLKDDRATTAGLYARRTKPFVQDPSGRLLLTPDTIMQLQRNLENEIAGRNDTGRSGRSDGGADRSDTSGGGIDAGGAGPSSGGGDGQAGLPVSDALGSGATSGSPDTFGRGFDLSSGLGALGYLDPKLIATTREYISRLGSDFNAIHVTSSPLSITDGAGNTIRPGTYERIAGAPGKQASDILRDLQRQVDEGARPDIAIDKAKRRMDMLMGALADKPGLVEEIKRHLEAIENDYYAATLKQKEKAVKAGDEEAILRAQAKLDNMKPSPKMYEASVGRSISQLSGYKIGEREAGFWLRSQIERVSSLNNILRLKYNIKSSAINLLQPLETLWPRVSTADYARITADSLRPSTRKRLEELGVIDGPTKLEGSSWVPADSGLAAEIALDDDLMALAAELEADWATKESMGVKLPDSPAPVRVPKTMKERIAGASPFASASAQNKIMGYLYGELDAKKRGLTDPEQIHRNGLAWAEIVEFDNSTYNAPPIMRDTMAKLLLQYKGFTFKSLENLADLASAPGTRAERAARLAKWGVAKGTTGGAKVLAMWPLGAAGLATYAAARDALKARGMSDEEAQRGAEAIYFGLPALLGADISSSVSVLDEPFGNTAQEQALNFAAGPTISSVLGTVQGVREGRSPLDIASRVSPYVKQGVALSDALTGNNKDVMVAKNSSNKRGSRPPTLSEVTLRTLAVPLAAQSGAYADREILDGLQKQIAELDYEYALTRPRVQAMTRYEQSKLKLDAMREAQRSHTTIEGARKAIEKLRAKLKQATPAGDRG